LAIFVLDFSISIMVRELGSRGYDNWALYLKQIDVCFNEIQDNINASLKR